MWGRKRGKWWTGLYPSNTWVKLVSCRLTQQIETGIRQTGSTMANSSYNLLLQTQQSRPPIKPCTVLQQCDVVIPPSSSFNTQSVRVPTTPAHIFFLRKKILASHRVRGGISIVSLCACVCVYFFKLNKIAQSGPVILVIVCHLH